MPNNITPTHSVRRLAACAASVLLFLAGGCSLTPPRTAENQARARSLDLLEEGQAFEKQGQYEPAINRYLQARDFHATPQVYHRLGHSYAQINELETARQYLQKAFELTPTNATVFYELAHVEKQLQERQPGAATATAQPGTVESLSQEQASFTAEPLAAEPASPSVLFSREAPRGSSARMQAAPPEELASADGSTVASQPVRQEISQSDVMRVLFPKGESQDVTTARAGSTFLADAEFHVEKARSYIAGGRTDLAVMEYKEAITRAPRNSQLHVDLARVYQQQGDEESARKELLNALRKDPRNAEALLEMSQMKSSGSYATGSQALIEQAGRAGASDFDTQILLGDMELKREQQEKAAEHYQAAMRLQPNSPEPYLKMGNLRRRVEDMTQARRYYLEALKRDPGHIPSLNNLAVMADADGQYDQARQYLEAILKADPNWAKAYFNLGALYETGLNDKARAIEYYEKYLQIGGDLEQKARDNIAALRSTP